VASRSDLELALDRRVGRVELWCVVLAAMNGAQIVGHLSARYL
jgi:hypothetical protein